MTDYCYSKRTGEQPTTGALTEDELSILAEAFGGSRPSELLTSRVERIVAARTQSAPEAAPACAACGGPMRAVVDLRHQCDLLTIPTERSVAAVLDASTEAVALRVLSEHESRWTTHGDVRLYDVIHCVGDCDWSLRQKALMSDDHCYEAHRQHVAEVLAAALASDKAANEGGVRDV